MFSLLKGRSDEVSEEGNGVTEARVVTRSKNSPLLKKSSVVESREAKGPCAVKKAFDFCAHDLYIAYGKFFHVNCSFVSFCS